MAEATRAVALATPTGATTHMVEGTPTVEATPMAVTTATAVTVVVAATVVAMAAVAAMEEEVASAGDHAAGSAATGGISLRTIVVQRSTTSALATQLQRVVARTISGI